MNRATVPKAAIDEDREFLSREDNIRPHARVACDDLKVLSEAMPPTMKP
jgi:hypothetical protein